MPRRSRRRSLAPTPPKFAPMHAVYRPGTTLRLFSPGKLPIVPPMDDEGFFGEYYPHDFNDSERARIVDSPLEMCAKHEPEYNAGSTPMSITLQEALTPGEREWPTHVWTARSTNFGDNLLVVRLYDPLYYGNDYHTNRFTERDQLVAVEKEVYSRLEPLQGKIIPRFHGVFVAEIPADARYVARYVYAVVLDWMPGVDVGHIMANNVGRDTCIHHKAAIINSVAKYFWDIVGMGAYLDASCDSNTLMQLEPVAATVSFCHSATCPLRHRLYINEAFTDPKSIPTDVALKYTPRITLIDMMCARFLGPREQFLDDGAFDFTLCRTQVVSQWCSEWVFPFQREIKSLRLTSMFIPELIHMSSSAAFAEVDDSVKSI
ncbi:hypothetical protein R3P38DRAFT_3492728 [Favolaschia claudopus]|uniref:Uncharacterized protein n=1 Tax=Favolaschia claudopus TaxID=2862362 RepID=A0AAW0EEB3_9AGAR